MSSVLINQPLKNRLYFVWGGFLLLASLVSWRLFDLQIINHGVYLAQAQGQQGLFEAVKPIRGSIFSRGGYPLATNRVWYRVFAVPKQVVDPMETASLLASELGLNKDIILERLDKPDDPYEPLINRIDEDIARSISNLDLAGIYTEPFVGRFYPEGSLAAHLLGFVDQNQTGRYGLEGRYHQSLLGQPGFLSGPRDALGKWTGQGVFEPAQDGQDLVLTIDHAIQFRVEQELERLVEAFSPLGGSILVLEPATGTIRAMASTPTFDPNNYRQVEDVSVFLNQVVNSQFEPGSVTKVLTMSSAIDDGAITPETSYVDTGLWEYDGYVIKNFDDESYGKQTMTEVIEKSLNIGAIFAVEQMAKDIFYNFLKKFGLGQKTGISLPGELDGDLDNLKYVKYKIDINYATAAFGQGISVTPLQLALAVGAIANGGELMAPRLFESDQVRRQGRVISQETARQVSEMMESAIKNSYTKAGVVGYRLAGKTGTAQIAEAGGYAEGRWTHSFVGFGPLESPEFLILLKLDQPKGVRYANTTLSPAFHNLATFLLNFYKVAPSQPLQ